MSTIREIARVTGKANGTIGELAQLAVNVDRQISGDGTAWPQTSGQGLIDNCWLIWSNMVSRVQTSTDAEPMTLGQALARFRTRVPVELRDGDAELGGHIIRVSMRAAVNDIWPDLPLGKYSEDADERDRVAYSIRKRLGQHLRDSLNAVCVHRPRQRSRMATWWVSSEWQSGTVRRRNGNSDAAGTESVVLPEPSRSPLPPVAEPQAPQEPSEVAEQHPCPHPECAGRTFNTVRALAIHEGHIHKDKPRPGPDLPITLDSRQPTFSVGHTGGAHPAIEAVTQLLLDNEQLRQDLSEARRELAKERAARADAESKAASMRKLIQIVRQVDEA